MRKILILLALVSLWGTFGCESDDNSTRSDGDRDGLSDGDSEAEVEADEETGVEGETEAEAEREKPWEFTRPDSGDPISEQEVTEFTKAITGMWKQTNYFNWAWWVSHGYQSETDKTKPDYRLWWQDTNAIKNGDTITFSHFGGADNLALRTARVLNNAIAGYELSGNEMFRRLVVDYCKGFVALSQGLEWQADDPVKYLQARAVFSVNHSYEMEGGRKVVVDYDPVKVEKNDWNASTLPNNSNPYWGPIWVRTMRSKDDVPHMYRTAPLLMRLAKNASDPQVKEWSGRWLEYLQGFAKDIVDNNYHIRTRDKDGKVIIPKNENGTTKDLASFVLYEILDKNAECNAKLSSALLAYGDPRGLDCGTGGKNAYETMATAGHYFNHEIVRIFHLSALTLAEELGYYDIADNLMIGLMERTAYWMDDVDGPKYHGEWFPDVATHLVASATAGLPLTSREARLVMQQYRDSVDYYTAWPYWDPWASTVPDGTFDFIPNRDEPIDPQHPENGNKYYVGETQLTYFLEYCYSPFRNPNGAKFVDCDIVSDPAKWGVGQ